jgi:hypothetical protein
MSISDLQTAIDIGHDRAHGIVMLPAGLYVGDAILPPGVRMYADGPVTLKGTLTIPKGGEFHCAYLTLDSPHRTAAVSYKADGTTVINQRLDP